MIIFDKYYVIDYIVQSWSGVENPYAQNRFHSSNNNIAVHHSTLKYFSYWYWQNT